MLAIWVYWAPAENLTLAVTLDGATLAATGALADTGVLSASLSSATITATGALAISGSFGNTLAAASLTATGALAIAGTLTQTLADATGTETGALAIAGVLNSSLGGASLTAAGTIAYAGISGSLNQSLGDAGLVAVGTTARIGGGRRVGRIRLRLDPGELPPLPMRFGHAAVTLDRATLVASSVKETKARLSGSLENVMIVGFGEVSAAGASSVRLGAAVVKSESILEPFGADEIEMFTLLLAA